MTKFLKDTYNVEIKWGADAAIDADPDGGPNTLGMWKPRIRTIYLRSKATLYMLWHEERHVIDDFGSAPPQTPYEKELGVYEWLVEQGWLNNDEIAHAALYLQKYGPLPGPGLSPGANP